ncbi:MAG: hypothetical protein IPM46_01430 [Flavobacteriales bacterium]|nr:hypothetical protein [Flavobacteriales bacterium]
MAVNTCGSLLRQPITALLLLIVLLVAHSAGAQDYRTQADGNWSTLGVWDEFDGVDRVDADVVPTSAQGIITITHVVTSNTNRTVDEVVVSGGTLNLSGGTLTVNDDTGTDLECSVNLFISGGTALTGGAIAWTSMVNNDSTDILDISYACAGQQAIVLNKAGPLNYTAAGYWTSN